MLIRTIIFLFIIIGVPLMTIAAFYNSLIGKKNQVDNAFAGIEAMLKKRYDLIPNLVSSVQQYMTHERGTLTELTQLRTKALSGQMSDDEKVEINNKMTKMLGGLMVAVENYPTLKASDNFIQLQRALNEVEEQLSASRRAFNSSVTDYNNAVEMFPTSIFAGIMSYQRKALFEIPEAERKNIDVKSLFNR